MPFAFDHAACAGRAEDLLPALVRLVAQEGWPHTAGERFVGIKPELPVVGKVSLTLTFAPPGGVLRVEQVVARLDPPAPDALHARLASWNAEHDHVDLVAFTGEQGPEAAVVVRAELVPNLESRDQPFLPGELRRAVERVAREAARLRAALSGEGIPLR